MGMREEPQHKRFEGFCWKCGVDVVYYAAVKCHPENVLCDSCEKLWIKGKGEKVNAISN